MRTAPRGFARALVAALLAVAAVATRARADAWQSAAFTSPGGKPARGIAVDSSGSPKGRLLIGCEAADPGWRGVELLFPGTAPGDPTETQVVVSFFGRSPVAERWRRRPDGQHGVLLWPATAEPLLQKLVREDTTRGKAAVTLEVREPDHDALRAVFPIEGIAERAADVAAACRGWGGTASTKRRERGW
jgi:hypothetical protein